MAGVKPLTRRELMELSRKIHSGWYPLADPKMAEAAIAGIWAVLDDPMRNPRATVRAARLIFEIEWALVEHYNENGPDFAQDESADPPTVVSTSESENAA